MTQNVLIHKQVIYLEIKMKGKYLLFKTDPKFWYFNTHHNPGLELIFEYKQEGLPTDHFSMGKIS